MILVLGADFFGGRLLKACELVRDGYASRVLVSGPRAFYGLHEHELSIPWAVAQGCPAAALEGVKNTAVSTQTEAVFFRDVLARAGVRRYLMVTSDFHSARAGRIFRREIPNIPVAVIAAPYAEFRAGAWWKDRQSAKVWLLEWTKTLADWLGI